MSDQRIARVERGLVEFSSHGAMFHPERARLAGFKTLEDRMRHYKIPALSIAVIDDFDIAWTKADGELEAGSGRATSPNSLFQAASATKLVVAALVLNLVEKGVLDLDRDVDDGLKSWRRPTMNSAPKIKSPCARC